MLLDAVFLRSTVNVSKTDKPWIKQALRKQTEYQNKANLRILIELVNFRLKYSVQKFNNSLARHRNTEVLKRPKDESIRKTTHEIETRFRSIVSKQNKFFSRTQTSS